MLADRTCAYKIYMEGDAAGREEEEGEGGGGEEEKER